MLDIKGKTILERQIEVLNACGVKDVAVVRGYKKEAIKLPNVRYYDNDELLARAVGKDTKRVQEEDGVLALRRAESAALDVALSEGGPLTLCRVPLYTNTIVGVWLICSRAVALIRSPPMSSPCCRAWTRSSPCWPCASG